MELIIQENQEYKKEIQNLNDLISRPKNNQDNKIDSLNYKYILENKIKELENENKSIKDKKEKYEIEFKVLQERHSDLKKTFESCEYELNFLKIKQGDVKKILKFRK